LTLFFDNVGGQQLADTVPLMRTHGRVVLCGRISETSGASPSQQLDLSRAVPDRLSVRGFIVLDHLAEWTTIRGELAHAVAAGDVRPFTTTVDGLNRAPEALAALFRPGAEHIGKSLIRVAPDVPAST
jgi:NADPH-dependent curcumin reductase CurA